MWNAVNDCFDAMPMAATVDGKVCITIVFLEMYELNHLLFISCGYCIIYVLVGWIHFIDRNMVYTSVHNLRGHQ